jgi:hypothetical protein
MKKAILFAMLCLWANVLWAQTAPRYSNEFLNIGVSARALAMGNAHSAIVQDVTAGYWNPAGLVNIKTRYEVSAMHAEQFGGIAKYDFASFATPVDSNSHIGISAIRFGIDDIPDTRFLYDANGNINYDNVRYFSAADYAFLVSYARKTTWLGGLNWGANAKIIYRNAGDFANAFGFGLDFGVQWRKNNWRVGVMLRDITTTFNSWTHNNALLYDVYVQTGNRISKNSTEITLPRAIIGVSRDFKVNEKIGILATIETITTTDGRRNVLLPTNAFSTDLAGGLEVDYKKIAFVRMGINNFQEIKNISGIGTVWRSQLNFGLGVVIKRFSIDYALTRNYTDRETGALYSNIFSLKLGF